MRPPLADHYRHVQGHIHSEALDGTPNIGFRWLCHSQSGAPDERQLCGLLSPCYRQCLAEALGLLIRDTSCSSPDLLPSNDMSSRKPERSRPHNFARGMSSMRTSATFAL